MESVERVAEVVLYEGYLLYPYRRSAVKNQQRWTFGGIYPRRYSEASRGDEPWIVQTQCLLVGDLATVIEGKVRFLQVAERTVAECVAGSLLPVEALRVGDQVYRPCEEAIEREILLGSPSEPLRLAELLDHPRSFEIQIPEGSAEESLRGKSGETVGALVRRWQTLRGRIEVGAERLSGPQRARSQAPPTRLTVRVLNTAPLPGEEELPPREAVIRQTFVSTHTILRLQGGELVSLLEPPPEYEEAARTCENIKTWPVLVGNPGERHTLLSSPIILYDYPQIAPESPGDLFDTTEIDELLTLSVMTLTDEEKQEMRETDPRSREILERTEHLSPEQLMKLHGAIRSLQPVRREER